MSDLSLVITHTSTFDPDPKSCKIPASMASITRLLAYSKFKSSLYLDSNTAIAAKLPDPMVVKGR